MTLPFTVADTFAVLVVGFWKTFQRLSVKCASLCVDTPVAFFGDCFLATVFFATAFLVAFLAGFLAADVAVFLAAAFFTGAAVFFDGVFFVAILKRLVEMSPWWRKRSCRLG